jgi:hypothetical protein
LNVNKCVLSNSIGSPFQVEKKRHQINAFLGAFQWFWDKVCQDLRKAPSNKHFGKHFQPHYQNTFYVYYYKGKLLRDGTTPTKKSYNLMVKFIKEN